VKHKPKTLAEVVGNAEPIEKLVEWIKSWSKGVPKKRAVFVYGPPGIGKTAVVEALAHDLGMELVEKNASDYRTAEAVERFAGLASQYGTLFGGRRLVLLDELDGITGTADRGGVATITDIVKKAQRPIVLIANDIYDPRFATLRTHCLLIEFRKPTVLQVVKRLKEVSKREGIEADEEALKFVAERSGRDVRSAINDLQALAQGKKRLTYDDVSWLAERDRKEVIFSVLRAIFYSEDCSEAKRAVDSADVDPDMLFQWVYENAPHQLNDPHDLAKAMNSLSLADVYRGRLQKSQNWSLLRYFFDFMTAGVAMARERSKLSGWVPYKFPQRIRMLSMSKGERAMKTQIGMKIRKKCHVSAVTAVKEFLPYLRIIFENNTEMAKGLAEWLDLDSSMVEYLSGKKKAEAIAEESQ
jgi:replication factor C large subunit